MVIEESSKGSSGGLVRQLILGVVLLLVAAGAVYDYGFLQKQVSEELQKLVDEETSVKNDEDIHELLGREPSDTKDYDDGSRVETYSWQRPIPGLTHDVYAIYQKIEMTTTAGETIETHYRFKKAVRSLAGEKLPGTQTIPQRAVQAPGSVSTGFGGNNSGGRGRNRNQQQSEDQDDKSADDSVDKNESGENKADDSENKTAEQGEKTDDKKDDTSEKKEGDTKESEGQSGQGEAKKADDAGEQKQSGSGEKQDENKESENGESDDQSGK